MKELGDGRLREINNKVRVEHGLDGRWYVFDLKPVPESERENFTDAERWVVRRTFASEADAMKAVGAK